MRRGMEGRSLAGRVLGLDLRLVRVGVRHEGFLVRLGCERVR